MSSIGLYGFDALAHGAIIALVAAPLALWLAWRLAAGLPNARRIGLAAAAAYGVTALAGGAWALGVERASYEDEALFGTLIAGLVLLPVAVAILLVLTPKA